MTINSENLIISFEIERDGETKRLEMRNLISIPNVGDEVECNYVDGVKVRFEVEKVRHFLSSIGSELLQQITVSGRSI